MNITDWIETARLKLNRRYRSANQWTREAALLLYEFMDADTAVSYAESLWETFEPIGWSAQEAVEEEMFYWQE